MADKKTTELDPITFPTLAGDDLAYTVRDPLGTPLDRKGSLSNLMLHDLPDVGCQVVRTTDQSILTATWTWISWQSENWDTHGFWNAGEPTRLTVPVGQAGYYLIGVAGAYAGNYSSMRAYAVYRNGSSLCQDIGLGANSTGRAFCVPWNCAEGDYFRVQTRHRVGSTQNFDATYSCFWIRKVGN